MRVLVTGGSGFLGQVVVRTLVQRNFEVVCLVRSEASRRVVNSLGADTVFGDLDDQVSLRTGFRDAQAEVLINVASLGFGHAPVIVDAASAASFNHAVFVSTTAIFTSLPAGSKKVRLAAEETIMASGLRWTIVRPTMIYGNLGDRNMIRLLKLLQRFRWIPIPGGGQNLIQPVHVEDLAQLICDLSTAEGAVGRAINAPGPNALTLGEIVVDAGVAVGRRAHIVKIPIKPVLSLVAIYEKFTRSPKIKVEQVRRLLEDKDFSPDEARSFGFSPRTFGVGICEEAELLRAKAR